MRICQLTQLYCRSDPRFVPRRLPAPGHHQLGSDLELGNVLHPAPQPRAILKNPQLHPPGHCHIDLNLWP
jgi:hypothetical protein